MGQMDATDNTAKPMDRAPAAGGDNFNRTELYNNMSASNGAGRGGMDNAGQQGQNGISGDHIDFGKAGDIYGGKVQQAGISGSSDKAATGKGDDGVKSPQQQMDDYYERTGPRPDGGIPERVTPTPASPDAGPRMEAYSTKQDGKTNDVSLYDGKNNQVTDYQLNPQGDVSSRTVTDLNNNSVDTVKYGADGHAQSHTISKDGGPAQDAPVDPKSTAVSSVDRDGNVRSIDTTDANGTNRVALDQNGKPTSTDSLKYGADGSSSTRQDYNEFGRGGDTRTSNYDADGRLQSTSRTEGYATTTDNYDPASGKMTSTDYHSPYEDSTTRYSGDQKATASKFENGNTSFKVDSGNGNTYSTDYDAQSHTSTTRQETGDGSYRQTTEDDRFKKTEVQDGRSGIQAVSDEDKYRGTISKTLSVPGQPEQKWTEMRS